MRLDDGFSTQLMSTHLAQCIHLSAFTNAFHVTACKGAYSSFHLLINIIVIIIQGKVFQIDIETMVTFKCFRARRGRSRSRDRDRYRYTFCTFFLLLMDGQLFDT